MLLLSGNYPTAVYYIYLLDKALVFETIKRLSKAISFLLSSNNIANVDNCPIKLAYVIVFSTNMFRTTVNTVKPIDNVNC